MFNFTIEITYNDKTLVSLNTWQSTLAVVTLVAVVTWVLYVVK